MIPQSPPAARPALGAARVALALLAALIIVAGVLPVPVPGPAGRVPAADAAVVAPFVPAGRDQLAPGVFLEVGAMTTQSSGAQAVNVVEVDPLDPVITFEAALSNDRVSGLERTSRIAARKSWDGHRAIAAINADVWASATALASHAPNGIHIQDGELMVASAGGPATFGIGPDRRAMIGSPRVFTVAIAPSGASFPVTRVNQRRRSGELVLYTPRWGSSTGSSGGGSEVILTGASLPIRPSGSWTAVVSEVRTGLGNSPTGAGMLVLSGTGSAAAFVDALTPGQWITLTTQITPGWEGVTQAVSGREWLVRDGAAYVWPRPASANVAHPRTSIGIRADGRVVMATVDGRRSGHSTGVTLDDLAELMMSRGAIQAINLDGGGSTTLALRKPGDLGVSLVNRPSGTAEQAVTNSLIVFSTAPSGPLATAVIMRADGTPGDTIAMGSTVDFVVKGMDAAFNGVPMTGLPVAWSVEGAGAIEPSGRFRATGVGPVTIVAQAGFVAARRVMTVVPDTYPPVASAPLQRFVVGAQAAPEAVPIRIRWAGARDVGSGVATYSLRVTTDGSPWAETPLLAPTLRELDVSVPLGSGQRYGLNATDMAGNVGAFADAPAFRVQQLSEGSSATRFSGTWQATTTGDDLDGGFRQASKAGAKVRVTATGSQAAWVAPVGPTFGSARVYVDGRYTATVSLYRTAAASRQIVWAQAWSTSKRRTIEIRVVGTKGRPAVGLDGFLFIDRPPAFPTPLPAPLPSPIAPAPTAVP